jgi:hypothetical protein
MSWNDGWEKMKENGQYEVNYFGDLFVLGMSWIVLDNIILYTISNVLEVAYF